GYAWKAGVGSSGVQAGSDVARMAVTGRQKLSVFLAFQTAIVASASAMFTWASSRALGASGRPWAWASWSATRFHIAAGVSFCQKIAVWVCSAVRTVLVAEPSACTSARAWAERGLVSGGGPGGGKCGGAVGGDGGMVADWRNSGAAGGPRKGGGVGCQSPGGLPTAYGGGGAVNPSSARQARMSPATVAPQASPRRTACPGREGSSESWASVAVSWASNSGLCAGIRAA